MSGDFLQQAVVYLGAALLCVPLAKKMGLSSVLGYILAGALIGPYALKLVGQQGHDIMHAAEFGVVMMLFIIGLELEPSQFWRMRKTIVGLGGLQFAGTTAALFPLGLVMGWTWQQALVAALALSMSSTAMVLQTLKEKGLHGTASGRASFAILLFQDIAVIPILALLPLLAVSENPNLSPVHATLIDGWPQGLQALAVTGAVALVYFAGRYLVVPLLRIIARTHLHELFVAAALFLVVAVAFLMSAIGLSPALGAFMAGVVLANSEFRHELESDLSPFKSLLLGLFFIGVGSSINFDLLYRSPGFICSLLAGVVFIKAAVLYACSRFFKFKPTHTYWLTFGLSQVGEFAFVLLAFAGTLNILDAFWLDHLMAVTTLSMAVTPVLLLFYEKILTPRYRVRDAAAELEPDPVEHKHAVIIAGFGHFGSTIGRFLRANGVEATILDFDPDRVDLLRKMGFNVYYGDATRLDLLHSAGAAEARILIAAIDSPETNARLIEIARKHFPDLQIMARARNRFDAYDLIDHGVRDIYRETLYTSIHLAVDVLKRLGHRAYTATRQGQKFIQYDEQALSKLARHRQDIRQYVLDVRAEIEWQEQMLQADLNAHMDEDDHAWDSLELRQNILKSSTSDEKS